MKRKPLHPAIANLLVGSLLLAGCGDNSAPAQAATQPEPASPTRAQAKLTAIPLYVGGETLETELAVTIPQVTTGMMFRTNVAETAAMLFVFGQPHQASFWMKNTPVPLSAAYIDPAGIILEIHDLQPFNTNSVVAKAENVQYVLETAQGWFTRHHVGPGTSIRTSKGTLQETFFRRP